MKRKGNIFAYVLLLLCISMLVALPVSASNSKKKYKIKVSDIKISSRNVKQGERCRISMKITNEGYKKLDRVGISYKSPSTQFYYVPLKYKKSSRRWVGNFKAEAGMQKGIWQIWSIDFDRIDGDEGGWYSHYNRCLVDLPDPGSNLSKGNIRVRGTKGDYSKPEIQWDTLSVSKADVTKKGGKITYRLKVTDESPISRVVLNLSKSQWDGFMLVDTELEMKYNKNTEYYEGTVWKKKGNYLLDSIYAEDVFGNCAMYFNKESIKYFKYRKDYCGLIDLSQFRVDL